MDKPLPLFAGYTHLWDPQPGYTEGPRLTASLENHAKAKTLHEKCEPLCRAKSSKEPKKGKFYKGTFNYDKVTCKDCKVYVQNNVGMWNRARFIFSLIERLET